MKLATVATLRYLVVLESNAFGMHIGQQNRLKQFKKDSQSLR